MWDFKGSIVMKLWRVPVLLSAAVICSCSSITEDRNQCPCWYTIDFTEVDRSVQNLHFWIYDDDGVLMCRDSLYSGEYGKYKVELGRGIAHCYVWGNISHSTAIYDKPASDSYFVKADSCSSDPLYHCSKVMDTDGEDGYHAVILHKEHARVEFVIKGNIKYKEELQLELDMPENGRFVNGDFIRESGSIYAYPQIMDNNNHIFKFTIMRQSLLHGIIARITAVVEGKRVLVKEFPLGEWLILSGYDMSSRDLEDIVVELDMSIGALCVRCAGWESVLSVKIEI